MYRYNIIGEFVILNFKFKKLIKYFNSKKYKVIIYNAHKITTKYNKYLYGIIVDNIFLIDNYNILYFKL